MRVLHVINTLDQGGAEALVVNTACWLKARGVDSAVATIDGSPGGPFFFAPRLSEAGVRLFEPRGHAPRLFVRRAWDLGRAAADFRPDLLHAHLTRATMVARSVAIARRTPLVSTIHSLSYEPETMVGWDAPRSRKHDVARLLEGAVTTVVDDAVVAVGQAVADSARRRLHLAARRLVVIPNPVDFTALDAQTVAPKAALAREAGVPLESRWLVMVGRVAEPKGVLTAVRALAEVRRTHADAHLLLVGSLADAEYVARVKAEVEALALEPFVHLLGPRRDVRSWLNSAAVYLQPSNFEGLSLALIESIGLGCEAIASDIAPNREVVDPGRNGHLAPRGEAGSWARAIDEVLSGARQLKLDAAARASEVRDRFGTDRAMSALLELYGRVLA